MSNQNPKLTSSDKLSYLLAISAIYNDIITFTCKLWQVRPTKIINEYSKRTALQNCFQN